MKTTKEKADEMVSNMYNNIGLSAKSSTEQCIFESTKCSIVSVRYTLEVLEQIQDKNADDDIDNYHITMQILEQTELLTELESRI